MLNKTVRDIMISIDDYPTLRQDATLYDALNVLDQARVKSTENEEPFKAVLVKDINGRIIGKAGLLSLIMAMNSCLINKNIKSKYNVSNEEIDAVRDQMDFWKDNLRELSFDAETIMIKDIMQPVENCIDINAKVDDAINKLSIYNTISILVIDGTKIVGIIRLSDIFNEFKSFVLNKNK